ncbi:hypothetical protein OCU04_006650 [Sclerotinia nivalis]|uniref:Derlin n=1 Tax=Sclerotinia nivalis TaxID=352851 RepID=A0A9X0AK65_9HELO|nr:hypothetical protein OCU04_006650 [Sclerotinia nivalis]
MLCFCYSPYCNSRHNYGDFLLHFSSLAQIWVFSSTHTFVRLERSHCNQDRLAYKETTVYTYGSKLETASPRFSQPGDFLTYVLFVCAMILGLNVFITGGVIFTSALVLAFAYTSTQDDRGMKATFFVVTIPAPWIPYAMLLMTFVMGGGAGAAKIQATGLVAAHLHDFLTRLWPTFGGGRNLIPTPGFIRRAFETTQTTTTERAYGTAVAPPQRSPGTGSTSGPSGSVLPESWRSRGSGHRLGGD